MWFFFVITVLEKKIFLKFIFRMDTYGKCGDLNSAREIFDKLKIKTKPSISSMSM